MAAHTNRPNRATTNQQDRFLAALAQGRTVREACEAGGFSRATASRMRQRDEAFALAWADARADGDDVFEAEARRRAVEGVEKPIMYRGEVATTVREFSDRMLELILKARLPHKYRERVDVQHSTPSLTPEQLKAAREAGLDPEVEAAAKRIAAIPFVPPEAVGNS